MKDILEETFTPLPVENEKEPWIINKEDFTFGAVIGSGSFGDVHSGTWNNKKVAIKKFLRQKLNHQVFLEIQTECAILRYGLFYCNLNFNILFLNRSLKHPNIVKFEAMCLQQPNLCLLTELMDRGSLGEVSFFVYDGSI